MTAWHDLKPGEILRAPSGLLRVARKVTKHRQMVHVSMTIQRRSWTGRCYTVYPADELIRIGYQRTGEMYRSRQQFDQLILEEMKSLGKPVLTPEDVIGVG